MLIYEFIDPEKQINSESFEFVESFLKATGRTQIGWHYITDITWIYSKVKQWPRSFKILDAGGGRGPVQFLLAEMGFHVTNIDMVLFEPPIAYCRRYQTSLKTLPSFEPTAYKEFLYTAGGYNSFNGKLKKFIKKTPFYKSWSSQKYATPHDRWRSSVNLSNIPLGSIQWRIGNLCKMPEIPSGYFDAVVSLSAWEHIPNEFLDAALAEIRRVLKPNARWAVTTSGTEQSSTWWHEPSQSNCFSVIDLEKYFGAKSLDSQKPEEILDKYRQCSYLKDNLAEFYKRSGQYGMPWGIWEPKYIPVGLSL
ncbi:MAG: class I SAM-dependent methyltransferase [Xenococcaceae cyanobacterium MO_188.B32]|nr:class I SAM-dependent methyltransferase [Xenococcaceae cyanobacterium MO_188.B32]